MGFTVSSSHFIDCGSIESKSPITKSGPREIGSFSKYFFNLLIAPSKQIILFAKTKVIILLFSVVPRFQRGLMSCSDDIETFKIISQ
jgi:hypothetical protein